MLSNEIWPNEIGVRAVPESLIIVANVLVSKFSTPYRDAEGLVSVSMREEDDVVVYPDVECFGQMDRDTEHLDEISRPPTLASAANFSSCLKNAPRLALALHCVGE
ncbi:hypothetical protein GCM10025331_59770 [Actinoplanes utahensis]|nr:hypothetical protein Aut01nite_69530 [Actinoplanes utahensis]